MKSLAISNCKYLLNCMEVVLPIHSSWKTHCFLLDSPSFPLTVRKSDGGKDGEALEITVYDYFTKQRNIELRYSAYMPCLDVGKPKRPTYLPLEVCNCLLFLWIALQVLINALWTQWILHRFDVVFFHIFQLCSLVSLQRYTKALSSVQRASLVEKSRQKPPERIRVVTDVSSQCHLNACFVSF